MHYRIWREGVITLSRSRTTSSCTLAYQWRTRKWRTLAYPSHTINWKAWVATWHSNRIPFSRIFTDAAPMVQNKRLSLQLSFLWTSSCSTKLEYIDHASLKKQLPCGFGVILFMRRAFFWMEKNVWKRSLSFDRRPFVNINKDHTQTSNWIASKIYQIHWGGCFQIQSWSFSRQASLTLYFLTNE